MDPKWERFHNGPAFLWGDESGWPTQEAKFKAPAAQIMAVSASVTPSTIVATPEVPEHWALRVAASTSSWNAKLRRIAGVKRVVQMMIRRWKKECDARAEREGVVESLATETRPIDRESMADAEILLWRATQARFFSGVAERKTRGVESLYG